MSDLRAQLQTTLGTGYTLERERGGGMSRVFVARDEALGRDVVVKVLSRELSAALSAERLTGEIKLAAALQEPHIVPVLAAGLTTGSGLFVRPFGTAGVPIAVVEGYVEFHAWSDDGRSIYFVRANRTIEVVDVNANGEPVGPPRVVVPTSTLEGMSDVYRSVRFTLIPGTREMYVSLNGRRARSLMVLQNFAAFAARAK